MAYGKVYQAAVVTNEERSPESKKNIKLPDVCDAFDVEIEDTFRMLETVGIQLHFSPKLT